MIITRTPLRVSFLGGGTDLPDYYERGTGAVISTTINKYIYVIAKRRFDDRIILHYTRTENVEAIAEIKHDLMREALLMSGIGSGIEITTMADIPSEGTGLGSSSSITVGLLHALYSLKDGNAVTPDKLANDACEIEINRLKKPIGKQDQYAAAYGGMRMIVFRQTGIQTASYRRRIRMELENRAMLFYTGQTRNASELLDEQAKHPQRYHILDQQGKLCIAGHRALQEETYDHFCDLVYEGWKLKKSLSELTCNEKISNMYLTAIEAGALGCKLCGAGGGGFLLVLTNDKAKIREALKEYREMPIRFVQTGSTIIYKEDK